MFFAQSPVFDEIIQERTEEGAVWFFCEGFGQPAGGYVLLISHTPRLLEALRPQPSLATVFGAYPKVFFDAMAACAVSPKRSMIPRLPISWRAKAFLKCFVPDCVFASNEYCWVACHVNSAAAACANGSCAPFRHLLSLGVSRVADAEAFRGRRCRSPRTTWECGLP